MIENSLTLSQFQQLLGNAIRTTHELQNVWVQAEFSDLRFSGPHCYMELVEKDAAGTTRAKIRAMIWAGTLSAIRRKFIDATGRDIASGMKVLVRGSASHHNLYGLSFTISDIDPSYTLGDIERLRREILERLAREGLLNRNRSLAPPTVPQRIAVISAEGAAGYGDFINQLQNNPDRFCIYPVLFPAIMQGERTAPSVMAALDLVEQSPFAWDAVVIIRGGGATTDLNGFDNYDLARRVATFPLPVIVGIGHERDRTVLDEIACIRCKTPTAVAAWIIDSLRNAYARTTDLLRRIAAYGTNSLKGEHIRLTNLSQQIPATARNVVLRNNMRLDRLGNSIPNLVRNRLTRHQLALNSLQSRLGNASSQAIRTQNQRLQRLADMIRLLSPQNTLKRGYTITRINGKAAKSIAGLKPGDILTTILPDGQTESEITKINQNQSR